MDIDTIYNMDCLEGMKDIPDGSIDAIRPELQKKIDHAIRLLKAYDNPEQPIEIAYSGGKDSDVILQLAKEAGVNFRAIYKNTTIDPPGTIKHAEEMGVEVLRPRYTFAQLIAKKGLPSRMRRFCCEFLKEYKVLDKAVIGVRRDESPKRAERYKEPSVCRIYNKKDHVEQVLPILEWTTVDVAEFLQDRGIKCAPRYYDEQGNFHPERRLGCIGCPLAAKDHRLAEFKAYPGMVKLYINALKKFIETHPNSKGVLNNGGDAYAWFARDIFYDGRPQGNLFDTDWKASLEQFFGIKL